MPRLANAPLNAPRTLKAVFPAVLLALGAAAEGCCHPKVTAVALSPWNRGEPEGIPFYLPKPLLIVAKNFRYIEEAKVGLTDSAPIPQGFDDQSKYADVNARTTFLRDQTTAAIPAIKPNGYGSGADGGGGCVLRFSHSR